MEYTIGLEILNNMDKTHKMLNRIQDYASSVKEENQVALFNALDLHNVNYMEQTPFGINYSTKSVMSFDESVLVDLDYNTMMAFLELLKRSYKNKLDELEAEYRKFNQTI